MRVKIYIHCIFCLHNQFAVVAVAKSVCSFKKLPELFSKKLTFLLLAMLCGLRGLGSLRLPPAVEAES